MKALILTAMAATLLSGNAMAYQPSNDFTLNAHVISAQQEVDVRGCSGYGNSYGYYDNGYHTDNYNGYRDHNGHHTGAILGTVLGGALGNQVGHGDGRKAATIGGAVIGGMVGNEHDGDHGYRYDYSRARGYNDDRNASYNHNYNHVREVSCESGGSSRYDVTYEINGQTFHTRTSTYPGRYIPVHVTMTPLVD